LSSHRDYENDLEWSFLRVAPSAEGRLIFEHHRDDEYELVVPADWPTKVKSNAPDGTYRTGDLFTPHPTIANAYKLCGRSDDVLLMLNGEKTSPAPIERMIKESELVRDVLVFGSNRTATGVLIIPRRSGCTTQEIWSAIALANETTPTHSQLLPELVVILSIDSDFPKASKGTLQRGEAYKRFATEIDSAYDRFEGRNGPPTQRQNLQGAQLISYISLLVVRTLQPGLSEIESIKAGNGFDVDADLFGLGVNSLQSARIRNVIQRDIDLNGLFLAPNVVYESSSVSG